MNCCLEHTGLTLQFRFANSGFLLATSESSEVQTGVKSTQNEKKGADTGTQRLLTARVAENHCPAADRCEILGDQGTACMNGAHYPDAKKSCRKKVPSVEWTSSFGKTSPTPKGVKPAKTSVFGQTEVDHFDGCSKGVLRGAAVNVVLWK